MSGLALTRLSGGRQDDKGWRRPALYALVLAGLYLAYLVLNPFVTALAWAVIFAVLFYGMHTRLQPHIGSNGAALATTVFVAVAIVAPAMLLLGVFVREAPQFAAHVKQWTGAATPQFQRLADAIKSRVPPSSLEPQARAFLAGFFAILGNLMAMLFGLFFMLRDGAAMSRQLRDALPFPPDESERLLDDTRQMIVASVGAGAVVAAADAAVGGTAFWLAGIPSAALWGVVIGFASFVPIVGTAIVWVPAGFWLLWSGQIWHGTMLLLVCGIGMTLTGNVLRPMLMSSKTSLSGIVVFFGILGGAAAFGLIGLVIGPIILATTSRLLKSLRAAYDSGSR